MLRDPNRLLMVALPTSLIWVFPPLVSVFKGKKQLVYRVAQIKGYYLFLSTKTHVYRGLTKHLKTEVNESALQMTQRGNNLRWARSHCWSALSCSLTNCHYSAYSWVSKLSAYSFSTELYPSLMHSTVWHVFINDKSRLKCVYIPKLWIVIVNFLTLIIFFCIFTKTDMYWQQDQTL